MSAINIPFFHPALLQSHYQTDLGTAVATETLSEAEQAWLSTIDTASASISAARPTLPEGQRLDPQLAPAVVLTHTSNRWTAVYLWTALDGIQPFDDRSALHQHLRRVQNDATAAFSLEKIDGPVFEALAVNYLLSRGEHLEEVAQWFAQLPNLDDQLQALLAPLMEQHYPELPGGSRSLWLQVTRGSDGAVLRTMTLAQWHLQCFAGQSLADGEHLRWLNPDGTPLSEDVWAAFQQAIDNSPGTLPDAFVNSLSIQWATQRDNIAQLYGAAFYQALLQARSNGNIEQAHWPWLRAALPQGRAEMIGLIDASSPGQPLLLPGALLFSDPSASSLYAYDGFGELQRHASRSSLALDLAMQPDPSPLLALDDRPAWGQLNIPHLWSTPLGATPLLASVDAIRQCQARDLRTCLAVKAGTPGRAIVQVDEVLDVRRNLELRLAALDSARRWRSVPLLNQTVLVPKAGAQGQTAQWLKQHHELGNRFQALRGGTQDAEATAQALLAPGLAVLEPLWTSQNIAFDLKGTEPSQTRTVTLGDLLLERGSRSGGPRAPLPAAQATNGEGESLYALHPALVEGLLGHAGARLLKRLGTTVDSDRGWRLQGVWEDARQAMPQLRESLLRLDLSMQRTFGKLPVPLLDLLQQVLDYPLHSQRQARPIAAQVHGLAISVNGRGPTTLTNCFVVHAGGEATGPVLFWSCLNGLHAFDSLDQFRTWLLEDLQIAPGKWEWRRLLPAGEQYLPSKDTQGVPGNTLAISTWPITQPLTLQLHADERKRQQRAVRQAFQTAMSMRFNGELTRRYMHLSALDDALTLHVQGLSYALEYCHLRAVLPKWLLEAPMQDFVAYTNLVSQLAYLQNLGEEYLFDIPDLQSFSKARVSERLRQDMGELAPDPDQVLITLHQYQSMPVPPGQIPSAVPAATQLRRETLTAAALDQLSWFPGTPATVEMADLQPMLAGLTPQYLRELIETLNVAKAYRDLISEKFRITDPDYPERLRRYGKRVVPELSTSARQQQLMGTLSRTATAFVEHVLTLPDGLARPPLDGVDIVLRPFQLKAADYLDPDLVIGTHLIGPRDTSQGPQVLYMLYDSKHQFREFANLSALLQALRTDTDLQDKIIAHLPSRLQDRYSRGGFRHPHFPEAVGGDGFDVELRSDGTQVVDATPVAGNALNYLFRDNLAVLLDYALTNSVTRDEARWKQWWYLMTLGLEQGTVLLPGPLSSVVNAWESQSWFQSAFSAAVEQRWGEALGRFVAGLGLLAGAREGSEKMVGARRRSLPYAPGSPSRPAMGVASAQQARLKPFTVEHMALNVMTHDATTHLYSFSGRQYAQVKGQIYQVRQDDGHWHVYKGQRKGPAIEWQASGAWGLKPTPRVANAGFSITRILDLRGTQKEVASCFIPQTRSMGELFTVDPVKAQQLGTGYYQAQTYLLTALQNLNARHPERPLPAATEAILANTFGVSASTPKLLGKVRTTFKALLSHLCDRSLEPLDSHRYVVGENRDGYENTYGFVYPKDPLKRIFLTERFFRVRTEILQQVDPTLTTVDPLVHLQATTLIHEVSHLAVDTTDIAYLEASVPHIDTLLNQTPDQKAFVTLLTQYRQRLSLATPWADLFTVQDRESGELRDVDESDGRALGRILALARTNDLDAARDLFQTDQDIRSAIILANADSVSLLCSQLGRERWQ
ncbi:dermonecrotic toxin domain-containing protein [Pseudomonas sp. TE3610]